MKTLLFFFSGMRNVKPCSIENTFDQTHLGFHVESHTFWKLEFVQFKYKSPKKKYIYIQKSHLKVISQELCKLNICIHFPTCVFFFLESDLPSRLYRDTPSALLPPSKKKKPGALATKQFPLPPYPAGPSFINLSTESRSSRRGDKIYIRKALRSFCSGRTEQILKMFLIAFLKKDCVSENMFL